MKNDKENFLPFLQFQSKLKTLTEFPTKSSFLSYDTLQVNERYAYRIYVQLILFAMKRDKTEM